MSLLESLPIIVGTGFALQIALIDFRELRIPNGLLFLSLSVTLTCMFAIHVNYSTGTRLTGAIAGALLATSTFFFIHLLNPIGLGMGDVKFAAHIGLLLAWIAFPVGLLGLGISFIAAAIYAALQFAARGRNFNRLVPFAPFMLFGLLFVEAGLLI